VELLLVHGQEERPADPVAEALETAAELATSPHLMTYERNAYRVAYEAMRKTYGRTDYQELPK
jgi:hypothetical protein